MRDCFSASAFMSASLEYLSRERIAGSFGLGLAEGSKAEAPGMSIAGNETEVFKVGMPRLGSVRTRRIIAVPAKGLRSWTPCTYCFQKSPSGRLPVSSNLLISVDAERRIAPSRTRYATTRDETDRQVFHQCFGPVSNTPCGVSPVTTNGEMIARAERIPASRPRGLEGASSAWDQGPVMRSARAII